MEITRCAKVVCSLFLFTFLLASSVSGTALDDYVNAPDSVYNYQVLTSIRVNATATSPMGYTVYIARMTSQTWQTPAYSDHSVWRHTMRICVPDQILYSHGFMVVVSGNDTDDGQDAQDGAIIVCQTGAIAASLHQIPNMPIKFFDTPAPLNDGDQIIAYTMRQFLNTSGADPTKLVLFPMTKAAKRGLDTMQHFARTVARRNLTDFTVTGISKRGWTTWLLAAVDPRVTSIMPANIGLLNMANNLPYIYRSLGEYGFALKPYTDQKVFDFVGLPVYDLMMTHIDPLSYNSRYTTVRKLVVCASLDQFFLLDGPRHFYSALAGPKALNIMPNADHNLIFPGSIQYLVANVLLPWFHMSALRLPIPSHTWSLGYSNSTASPPTVVVTTQNYAQVVDAKAWELSALSRPGFRDFRLQRCAQLTPACLNYFDDVLEFRAANLTAYDVQGNSAKYRAVLSANVSQFVYTGFYVELSYRVPIPFPGIPNVLHLTSEANIFPDIYPFPFKPENYSSIGYTPAQVCAAKGNVTFSTQKVGEWNDGTNTFTQWTVTLRTNVDLYSVQVQITNAQITQIWGVEAVGTSNTLFSLPVWLYQDGKITPTTQVSFSYITRSTTSGDISLSNDACRPSNENCAVTVIPTVTSQWADSSFSYSSVSLAIVNSGDRIVANARVTFSFSGNATITGSWNLVPVSGNTYTCPLYNLQPGSSSNSCGYIARGAVTVVPAGQICI